MAVVLPVKQTGRTVICTDNGALRSTSKGAELWEVGARNCLFRSVAEQSQEALGLLQQLAEPFKDKHRYLSSLLLELC